MSATGVHTVSSRARRAALASITVAVLVLLLPAWLDAGAGGMLAAMVGGLVVAAFFTAGSVPLLLVGDLQIKVGAGLALLLLTYTLRLALVLLALTLLRRTDSLDALWLGLSIITSAVVWSAAHVAVVVRAPGSG